MKKRTTIKDIARIANVTPGTVSLALNNRPRISQQTREKILKIAEELNYQPNYLARGLRRKQSYSIGLIIPDIRDPFYPEMAKGIEEKADESGYSVILCNTNRKRKSEKHYIDMLRAKGIDGIIFSTVLIEDPYIKPLVEESFPFVLANRVIRDPLIENRIDYVVLDNFSGGYKAVEHLYRLGHDRIGIIARKVKASSYMDRLKGAKKFLRDCGIGGKSKGIAKCGFFRQDVDRAAHGFLNAKKPPTAIFALDDQMALQVRDVLLDKGVRIPEDIALVGFDDIDTGALKGIELTTINQKKYEVGTLAVDILIKKIEQETASMARKIVLQPELIIRKSCGYAVKGYRTDRSS